ncbi:hypothetical protein D3C85_1287590 [compost metagenome]
MIGHVGRRVAGHRDGLRLQLADGKGVAIGKKVVKLPTVGGEAGFEIENALEHALHAVDLLADGDAAAQLLFQVGGGGQVVGVGVGFDDPVQRQLLLAHEVQQPVGGGGGGAPGLGIVVQHRVDDRRMAAALVVHHIADGPGDGIETGVDLGIHRDSSWQDGSVFNILRNIIFVNIIKTRCDKITRQTGGSTHHGSEHLA